ncbi:uncharacterized protein I206_107123 [Kwoniella pini CBS 10737]|uniref:DUF866-domain-containing protein n=1 Tax=Kwoniella pini CBS 10737 TaxID=1296096 RepID=A0A1B9HZ73_9TREE|nr:uncharacterized protein I206_05333 [Kwoniella pini CBS 10737]OCF48554.1 hypothetical protein I206_05333 [Kwoniella pini CBS 10737]
MELEGVKEVRPEDDYEFFFTVQCSSCREVHPKTVSFNQREEHEISGSKGTANFVWRCGNCKKEHSASFAPSNPSPKSKSKSIIPISYSSSESFQPLISLDCRGLEFIEFHINHGKWFAKSENDSSLKEFEINWDELKQQNEDRWDDYDDNSQQAISISECKSKIERA